MIPKPISLRQFALIVFGVIILDQLTKFWIVWYFVIPNDGSSIVLIPRLLQIIYQVNTGAAFSFFQEHTLLLALFSSAVAAGLLIWSWRLRGAEQSLRWPLGLILGGALGNLIDRYRLRHVVDFIDAHWDMYHFPTFNAADSAICVGMGLLIWLSFCVTSQE